MPRTGKKTYDKPTENNISKGMWLSQWDGVRVYQDTKRMKTGQKCGIYVFFYDYDWGPDEDGKPMTGKKLGIAPFYELKNGDIRWQGRQIAGKPGFLRWQRDLVGIAPEEGHALARGIIELLKKKGLTEEVAEEKIETIKQNRQDEEMDEMIKKYA